MDRKKEQSMSVTEIIMLKWMCEITAEDGGIRN